jgi:hypothetical protein
VWHLDQETVDFSASIDRRCFQPREQAMAALTEIGNRTKSGNRGRIKKEKGRCNAQLSNVRLLPNPHMGWACVFMHSVPLTLLFLLCVKGLTRMCYGWNNEGYMLTPHLAKQPMWLTWITNSLPLLGDMDPNHNYYKATNGTECYSHPPLALKGWRPRQHTIYIISKADTQNLPLV